MKHFMIFVVVILSVSGCTSTHQVDTASADRWIPMAQKQFLGDDIDLRTIDGSSRNGELYELTVDSVKLRGGDENPDVAEPLERVTYLGQSPNAAAPILGGLGGILVGTLLGGVLGSSTSEPDPGSFGLNTVGATIGGALIGGVVGGVGGAIVGGLATKVDRYEISHAPKGEPQRK